MPVAVSREKEKRMGESGTHTKIEKKNSSESKRAAAAKRQSECAAFHVLGYRYGGFSKIGSGAYGVVCSAVDAQTQTKVAIKRIHPWSDDEWDARHTLRELRLMRLLSAHPNIISLIDVVLQPEGSNDLFIIMELMESDLHRIITSKQVLTCAHVSCLMAQLLLGIQAMHSVGCIHRDLKPGNLLVSRGCQLRITDFGLSRYIELDGVSKRRHRRSSISPDKDSSEKSTNPLTEYVVTRWYRCPEVLLAPHLPYSTAVDCWSAGCIFAELVRRKPLFQGKNFVHQVQVILERLGTPKKSEFGFEPREDAARFLAKQPVHTAPGLATMLPTGTPGQVRFAARLLKFNPTQRASVDEALADEFFDDMPELPGRSRIFFPRGAAKKARGDAHHSQEPAEPQEDEILFSQAAVEFRDSTLADVGFEFGFENPDTSLDELKASIEEDVRRVEDTRRQRTAWLLNNTTSSSLNSREHRTSLSEKPFSSTAFSSTSSKDKTSNTSASATKNDDNTNKKQLAHSKTEGNLASPASSCDDMEINRRARIQAAKNRRAVPSSRSAENLGSRSPSNIDDDEDEKNDDHHTPEQPVITRTRLFGLPLSLRGSASRKKNRVKPSGQSAAISPSPQQRGLITTDKVPHHSSSQQSTSNGILSRLRTTVSTR